MKPTIAISNIKHSHKEKEIIDFLTTITYKSARELKFIIKYTNLPLLIFKPLNENEIQYLNDNCECINFKNSHSRIYTTNTNIEINMIYAVMLFYHWSEIMDEKPKDDEFILTNTIITEDQLSALNTYANTRCPASVLLEATSRKELDDKIVQTIKNYKNKEWLETNLYPVL